MVLKDDVPLLYRKDINMTYIAIISPHHFIEEALSQCDTSLTYQTYTSYKDYKEAEAVAEILIYDVEEGEGVTSFEGYNLKTPIIMLCKSNSNNGNLLSNIHFMEKPLLLHELSRYMHHTLQSLSADSVLSFGNFSFYPQSKVLFYHAASDKISISLTEKEAEMIQYLYEHDSVDKNRLLKDIWKYDTHVDTHTVETHIYRLRQKIGESCDGHTLISTELGRYRLKRE